MSSSVVGNAGAVCFGIVVGYIVYRTLVRRKGASITDIAAVVSAVGGGTVTAWFSNQNADTFGWYAIGLLGGMAVYFVAARLAMGKEQWALVLGDTVIKRGNPSGTSGDDQMTLQPPR
jgi:hypothetical protein